jgi:hypothetical protein
MSASPDPPVWQHILVEAGPDGLIGELVAGEDARAPIAGLHVFTFGGVRRTAEWVRAST